jgi:hypothetical protein
MADILIRGMKMPKGKDALTLAITSDGEVLFVEFDRTIDGGIILSHADIHPVKAFEVPDHGRLIDADALKNLVLEALNDAIADGHSTPYGEALCTFIAKNIVSEIEDAPTVIPAEPPKEEK